MAYTNTTPLPGDSEVVLLGKLLQLFGGSPTGGDGKPQLLADILAAAANGGGGGGLSEETVVITVALNGMNDYVAAGTNVAYVRAPFAFTLTAVRASLNVASTSGAVTVDVNLGGASVLGTKLTIDQDETTSVTAAAPATIVTSAITDDGLISFDIDGAGSNAKGLVVTLIGTKP